ncbi:uncharacterized protein LOC115971712 [Quercus lobata]|uniref:uncharacterized protein LOC115971712 n=1 Tax=Quercus lobata TaxID=97700 RepID=UPI00124669F2|nr:uncharacterized protein LOC115971712 [Quercus lobata]
MGNDAMSKALNQISRSPFTHKIKEGVLLRRFTQPTFTMYNGQTDPVENVSHFNQRMAVYSKNEALMCKMFLFSLRSVAMRWFNGLAVGSVNSFRELTQAFGSYFITCNGDFDDVAIKTFKVGLPTEHGLRKSLIEKPTTNVRKLMEQIDKYKRVEEDQQ